MSLAGLLKQHTDSCSVREANYALDSLGAVGVGVLSSHAGKYLGNPEFKPFFENLNNRKSSKEIIYIHPTEPYVNVNGSLVSANPRKDEKRKSMQQRLTVCCSCWDIFRGHCRILL